MRQSWADLRSQFTSTFTSVEYADLGSTTLCNGQGYYLNRNTPKYVTLTIPTAATITPTVLPDYPRCYIGDEDCGTFQELYSSSLSEYESDQSLPSPTRPICQRYRACPREEDPGLCKLHLNEATVYYWPVTITTGSTCGGASTTLSHSLSARSTVISGTTFISPSIYMFLTAVSASSYQNKFTARPCGDGAARDVFLTFDPSEVSTHWGKTHRNRHTFAPLNLADLNDPTPASVYFAVTEPPDCVATPTAEPCTQFIDRGVPPFLSVPVEALQKLTPDFADCLLHPSSRGSLPRDSVTWVPLEETPVPEGWPIDGLVTTNSHEGEGPVETGTF